MTRYRSLVSLLLAGLVQVLAAPVQADGLIANWTFDEPTGSTTLADASGNGHTGTLVGADTVTRSSAPIGTGLYFHGASGTGNYVGVPCDSTLSGMNYLTLSAWVFVPALPVADQAEIFSLYNQTGGNQVYQLGFSESNLSRMAFRNAWPFTDTQFSSHFTAGQWQLLTAVYDGGSSDYSVTFGSLYVNGVCVRAGEWNVSGPTGLYGPYPLATAAAGQILKLAGGDNEWNGGLDDLGMWNVNLTGAPYSTERIATIGAGGGEISALFNTPTSGLAALSQYGVKAMDRLFTLYDARAAGAAAVNAANGTLGWKYVAAGLPGVSGGAGQVKNGVYYVQLDANGGGVETVLSGDANLDGKVDINDLSRVLTNYDRSTGMAWDTGDFNGDGKVDINDLSIVLTNYDKTLGSAAAGARAVPEPSGVVLLAMLLPVVGWGIRRGRCVFARVRVRVLRQGVSARRRAEN